MKNFFVFLFFGLSFDNTLTSGKGDSGQAAFFYESLIPKKYCRRKSDIKNFKRYFLNLTASLFLIPEKAKDNRIAALIPLRNCCGSDIINISLKQDRQGMSKSTDSSIKLLVLYDMLYKKTDEEHALSTNEIIAELDKRGIPVSRKILPSGYSFAE